MQFEQHEAMKSAPLVILAISTNVAQMMQTIHYNWCRYHILLAFDKVEGFNAPIDWDKGGSERKPQWQNSDVFVLHINSPW